MAKQTVDPAFNVNEMVTTLVQNNVDKLITGIYKAGTAQYKNIKLKTGYAFENYLATASNKYGMTKTILYRDKTVPLYDFYVNVDVICQDEIVDTSDINALIQRNSFITIYGSGGSGKSTLLKHFFLNTMSKTDLIPIFVELKTLNEEDISLNDCIYKCLSDLKFDLEREYFEKSLKSGRYLILLDGFDEVADHRREKLMKEITQLTDKYDDNYYVISSRQNDSIFNGWSKSTDFRIVPLNKNKAVELIDNLEYNNEVKSKFLNELKGNLFDRHISFCSNPLLLTLMLLTYEEFAEIPEKVHIFYGRAFDVLYSKHDATKAYKRKLRTSEHLGYDEFVKILSSISVLSYLDSAITFDTTSLKEYIDNAKKITKIFDFEIEDFINDLVESICLLYLDGLKYNFQHRSFQEFFAAKFILNLPDKQQFDIISKLIDRRYSSLASDNVLNLIIEMDKHKFEKVFLIPKLKELKDLVMDETLEKTHFNFLATAFMDYGLDPSLIGHEGISEIADCINFTFKRKSRKYYYEFVSYIITKYKGFPNLKNPMSSTDNRIDIIKKYSEQDDDYYQGIYKVKLENVSSNEELMNDLLNHAKFHTMGFDYAMGLLEILEERHKENDSILVDLFGL